jgi:hypothetical protein
LFFSFNGRGGKRMSLEEREEKKEKKAKEEMHNAREGIK